MSRALERSLLFSFAAHGLGMLSMVLFLLPGMPGGGIVDDFVRVHYVASHPWLWRLGWLPWQITAVSDLLIAVALVRTPFIPRLPAVLTLLFTLVAVFFDQLGQVLWITRGIALAQRDGAAYLIYEKRIFAYTAVWGATLYCVSALGWTWALSSARTWNRALTVLSIVLWTLFFTVCIGPLFGMHPKIVAAGNALAFVLLQLWFVLVIEAVIRRSRPTTTHGRYALFRHPRWRLFDVFANSRFVRACGELLPPVSFRSDITDVIYVNYIVDADRLVALVPDGLELQRLGDERTLALFTFLTFRHGNFGPRVMGPLRRLLPSPIQTNWRIHVRDPRTGLEGVHFVTNAISSTIHSLCARAMSEGMPMHVLREAEVGATRVMLDAGGGSAPDAIANLHPVPPPTGGPWRACFPTWRDFLAYAVPQDRAFSTQPGLGRVTRQEIELGIPIDACEALEGDVHSSAASAIVGDATPFCFRVPKVAFSFSGERYDALPTLKMPRSV